MELPPLEVRCDELMDGDCILYLYKLGPMWYCSNSNCLAQRYQRVRHFANVMGLKIGDVTLSTLMTGKQKVDK